MKDSNSLPNDHRVYRHCTRGRSGNLTKTFGGCHHWTRGAVCLWRLNRFVGATMDVSGARRTRAQRALPSSLLDIGGRVVATEIYIAVLSDMRCAAP